MAKEIREILFAVPGKYKAGANAVGVLIGSLVENELFPESLSEPEMFLGETKITQAPEYEEKIDVLQQAAREYLEEHKTPETVTNFFAKFWQVNGEKVGVEIAVPDFPDSQENLTERLKAGDMPIYVPPEVSSQANRHLLGNMWRAMQSHSVQEGNSVTEETDRSGWRYVKILTEAPHLNTNEEQLRKAIEKEGREGMTLSEYIIASQVSHLFSGKYFDHGFVTWSRLLGSRAEGRVVGAGFGSDGSLFVDWFLRSRDRDPGLGGRSSLGVSKT